jgi:hypothetical protein
VRRLLLTTALAAALLPCPASAWTSQGGATLAPGRYAVEAAVGWPQVRLVGRVPLAKNFEVDPYLTFFFWNDLLDKRPTLGDAVGALVKVNLVDRGPFQLAVQGDPAILVQYWPKGTKVGWQIGFPELLMSYEVTKGLDLDFGLKVPLALVFNGDYEVEVRLPVLVALGAEYELTDSLHLFGTVEVGPNFTFAREKPTCRRLTGNLTLCDENDTTGGNRTGAYLNALIGVTYLVP